ncbi:MAG: hypothetical protein IJW68_03260 [Bacteroidaceae bacterium]|nr:hypothetical protein [Bacteroidaceae bacterium]MBQ8735721.1 hypothetical protein [Bacteroidaceae bacterium]
MDTIYKIRYVLNTLFLIGAVVTVILYITVDSREPFFYAGITSLTLKMAEFILRFII